MSEVSPNKTSKSHLFQRVAVVGTGVMGAGIAQTCAQAGYSTVMVGLRDELNRQAMTGIETALAKQVQRGRMTDEEKRATLSRIDLTTDVEQVKGCGIVIEAVTEDVEVKRALFRQLDVLCGSETILCSDTATIPIREIAVVTKHPERVIGLHILSPAPASKMVEIARTQWSSDKTASTVSAFCESLGKQAVIIPDAPGFVINRLLATYLLESVRLVEQGFSKDDIDTCMTVGCSHPVGPLKLLDLVGLDQFTDLANSLFHRLNDPKYQPPQLLKDMVARGELGQKSGRGFYPWK